MYNIDNLPNKVYKYIKTDSTFGLEELSELNSLRVMNHPNILSTNEFTVDVKGLGLILEKAQSDMTSVNPYLTSTDDKVRFMFQMASALNYMHINGYYNCDIKLENTLLIRNNAVIADPGFVRPILVDTKDFCNTYKSPQELNRVTYKNKFTGIFQASNDVIDSDIWALGVAFFYLVGGSKTIVFHKITQSGKNDMYMFVNLSPTQRRQYLLKNGINDEFIDAIELVLNIDPVVRRNALTHLLNLPLFAIRGYTRYIEGKPLNIPARSPKVFDVPTTHRVKSVIKVLLNRMTTSKQLETNFSKIPFTIFNTVDLLRRVIGFIPDSYSPEEIFEVLYQISASVFKDSNIYKLNDKRKNLQVFVVTQLEGILARPTYNASPLTFLNLLTNYAL